MFRIEIRQLSHNRQVVPNRLPLQRTGERTIQHQPAKASLSRRTEKRLDCSDQLTLRMLHHFTGTETNFWKGRMLRENETQPRLHKVLFARSTLRAT